MNCPQCNRAFDTASDSDLPVHNCSTCNGTWIRGHSLNHLISGSKDAAKIDEILDTILDLEFRESRRKCPSCTGRHLKAVVIERTELDFCASCKGLFFDPGELDRVFPGILDQDQGTRTNNTRGFWHSLLRFIKHK
jgi:Zn-finger nucleic acid-binding protein